jgi:hypothetical protein
MRARCWRSAGEAQACVHRCPCLARIACVLLSWTAAMSANPGVVGAQSAADDDCARAGQPWISVAFDGPAWTRELETSVLADLRAGLRLRGIGACALGGQGSEPPLGLLELKALAADRIAVSIELHDALTKKRVLRDVNVREVAVDARALAIADAADELLRASWAELALADAPTLSRPAPPEVKRAVRSSLARAAIDARDHTLCALAAGEYHGGGTRLLGADLALGLFWSERFGAELGFGLREGLRERATRGSVDTRALLGAGDLLAALSPRERALVLLGRLGVALASVRMRGLAYKDAVGFEREGLDVHARLGLRALLALGALFALRADIGLGVPLQSLQARDAGQVVTSTGGAQLLFGVGSELRF